MSGGDAFYLKPEPILLIGNTLLDVPHIKRLTFDSMAEKWKVIERQEHIADKTATSHENILRKYFKDL